METNQTHFSYPVLQSWCLWNKSQLVQLKNLPHASMSISKVDKEKYKKKLHAEFS